MAYLCRITNAVKESGGLKERLFHAAYDAKRQAIINGKELVKDFFCSVTYISNKLKYAHFSHPLLVWI